MIGHQLSCVSLWLPFFGEHGTVENKEKKFKMFVLSEYFPFELYRLWPLEPFKPISKAKSCIICQKINQIGYRFVFKLTNEWDNKVSALVNVSISGAISTWNMNMFRTAQQITVASSNPQILLDACLLSNKMQWIKKQDKHWIKRKIHLFRTTYDPADTHSCMYLLVQFAISVFMRPFELFFCSYNRYRWVCRILSIVNINRVESRILLFVSNFPQASHQPYNAGTHCT